MTFRNLLLACLLLLATSQGFAQTTDSTATDTARINRRKLLPIVASEAAFYVAGMSYLQFVWYKDHERVPFHFYNDARGYQQVDKFGHAFGAYVESYMGYRLLRNAGVPKGKALLYGGTLGLVLQTPIEVWDGLYEGWGFSAPDMVANAAGSALVIGQELLFDEQVARYKFSFSPSPYYKQANGYLGDSHLESLFLDYNAHTYWLSVPINKLAFKSTIPDWASVAVGYSAGGMFGEFSNRTYYRGTYLPETERYRQYLFSLDVDWTRIKTDNKLLNTLLKGMFFIKLPFPALEVNSKGQVKGHWLYY
ncbi:DUF2279 domain-containing protein [Pontibacter akesuensis]|uniref:Predicted lipoprotein n=1 Tax=Pontibacter akesuensis TaxID=388950 RepID=A0A1I7HRT9_9BACT|nr:DUF2279 domain-containing protein [Pontibacter akesuensis]GHA63245.1 DUF2279 domain-containing protein [Pontibacter akesuensis]SFU63349.1 Predicted lipoprotein [Pontibacter akesuensis]